MKNKVRHSDKPCPECNKWLYWVEEDEEDSEGHVKTHRYLECPSCGYVVEQTHRKPKKKIAK